MFHFSDNLHNFIEERNDLHFKGKAVPGGTEKMLTKCLKQIAHGLKYLHSVDIVHRSLRSQVVVYDPNGNWKLTDFRAARPTGLPLGFSPSPSLIVAPLQEIKSCDSRADIYAFGSIVSEICYPNQEARYRSVLEPWTADDRKRRLPTYHSSLDNIIGRMFKCPTDDRITLEEVIAFIDSNWNQIN